MPGRTVRPGGMDGYRAISSAVHAAGMALVGGHVLPAVVLLGVMPHVPGTAVHGLPRHRMQAHVRHRLAELLMGPLFARHCVLAHLLTSLELAR